MDTERKVGSVTYRNVDDSYFEQRGLRRHAGVWSLWALGVAAVISGDFSGWNLGLNVGGFGGLLVATIVITIMYVGLSYSIAEMSPALPHTGGAYSFARSAMGPWGGFITGLAENIEYVVTTAVVGTFVAAYARPVFSELIGVDLHELIWLAIFYVIFVALNVVGIEATMRFSVAICLVSLAVLAVFFVMAIFGNFDASRLNDIAPAAGGTPFLPFGTAGIFAALPFAIWFYLGIEELPLAAEEAMDPKKDVPSATIWGLVTLVVTAVLVLVLNTGVTGAEAIRGSGEPLLDGFRAILGSGTGAALLGLAALSGLIASFHTIMYAYGRNIYSLSRAGYFPKWMSVTHGTRKTPWLALVLGAVVGFGLALLLNWAGNREGAFASNVSGALLNMAVFGAVISYALQCWSFILLRRKFPDIERPYKSPVGVTGAAIAGLIALVALVATFLDAGYRPGVYGTAIWMLLGIVYFAAKGRHGLVLSPEEEFAVTRGEHGHPETEGYGTTKV